MITSINTSTALLDVITRFQEYGIPTSQINEMVKKISQTIFSNQSVENLSPLGQTRAIYVLTDIFDDPDDLLALCIYMIFRDLLSEMPRMPKIVGLATTLFNPRKKAALATEYIKMLHNAFVKAEVFPVFAGAGEDTEEAFRLRYERFPSRFKIFDKQGIGMEHASYSSSSIEDSDQASSDLIKQARNAEGKLQIVGIAAVTTLYEALKKEPSIKDKIELIMMGGWKEKEGHKKIGFNTLMDLQAFDAIINHYQVETLIVNSHEFVKDSILTLSPKEFQVLQEIGKYISTEEQLTPKQKIAQIVLQNMIYYQSLSPMNIAYCDPTTMLIALFPEFVQSKRVQLTFELEKVKGDYLNINTEEFFQVSDKEGSNVALVTDIHDKPGIRKLIAGSLFSMLLTFNKANGKSCWNEACWDLLETDKSPIEIALLLTQMM